MGTEKMVVVVEVETAPKYLTAQQARVLADAERKNETESIFANLMPRLEERAKGGWYSGSFRVEGNFFTSSTDTVCKRLESLGYTAKCSGRYNSYSEFEIGW